MQRITSNIDPTILMTLLHQLENFQAGLSASKTKWFLVGTGLLALVTLISYYPATEAGFIMDDDTYYMNDSALTDPQGLWRIWFRPLDNNGVWPYLPITRSTFWLERQFSDLNPTLPHWINLFLHFLSTLLLWQILRQFDFRGAWLAAMLFAVHPIHVQTVAWITDRKNLVALVFFLLCLWSYLRFDQKQRKPWYFLALFLFLCALLSKTSAIMLPVILIFCRLWLRRSWRVEDVLYILSFFVIAALLGFVRVQFELLFFGGNDPLLQLSLLERLLVAGHVPFFYLSKLIFPFPLIYHYPKWVIDTAHISLYLPWVSLLLIAGLLLWKYPSWGRYLFLGLGAYFIMLMPVMGFFKNAWTQFSFVADHWVYLPSLPVLILISGGLLWLGDYVGQIQPQRPKLILPLGAVLIVLWGGLTWNQTGMYQSHQTLWHGTLKYNPQAWAAYQELGREAMQAGDYPQAIQYFGQTLELKKDHPDSYNNRGVTYVRMGEIDQAIANFNAALQAHPEFAEAYHNRGFVYAQVGQFEQAIADYSKAIEYKPNYMDAYFSRGNARVRLNQYWQALEDYNMAVRFETQNPTLYHNRGLAYYQVQQYEGAILNFNLALRLNPQYVEALHNRGTAYYYLKNYKQALQDYDDATQVDPNYGKAFSSRGFLLKELNYHPQACQNWVRACQLGDCSFLNVKENQDLCGVKPTVAEDRK